jgi:hypothetical protein
MSNAQVTPFIQNLTLANAIATSGSFVYNMEGIGRASLQLNATWNVSDTTTVSLKISNDGVNFVDFSTPKTLAVNGTTTGLFELGNVDYWYLQVSWTTPAGGHNLTLVGWMNGRDGKASW